MASEAHTRHNVHSNELSRFAREWYVRFHTPLPALADLLSSFLAITQLHLAISSHALPVAPTTHHHRVSPCIILPPNTVLFRICYWLDGTGTRTFFVYDIVEVAQCILNIFPFFLNIISRSDIPCPPLPRTDYRSTSFVPGFFCTAHVRTSPPARTRVHFFSQLASFP